MGEGATLHVNGSYRGDGSLEVEEGGRLIIDGESTVRSATVADGELMLAAGGTILNLRGGGEGSKVYCGVTYDLKSGPLTIVDGNFSGELRSHLPLQEISRMVVTQIHITITMEPIE